MNVLSLPVEVIDTCLLPYLGWNDLLRLRRTCRKFKSLIEDYMRRHPEKAPELEINEKEKNFRAFIAMGIPFKRIFLNNQTGNQFYNKAPASAFQFLQEFGPTVTHLRVEKFSVWGTEKAKQFLEGFPNLVSFETAQTTLRRYGIRETPGNPNRNRTHLPSVFGRLRILKLYQSKPDLRSEVNQVLEELLGDCRSLEHFCIPFPIHRFFNSLQEETLSEFFQILNSIILQQNGEDAVDDVLEPFAKIQRIEFSNYPQYYISGHLNGNGAQEAFHQLCRTCAADNVQLVNVRERWLSNTLPQNRQLHQQLRQIGIPLVSLTLDSFSNTLALLDMPNLEKLKWKSCHFGITRELPQCNLPKLKNLDLTFTRVDSEAPCRYFFEGVVHEMLTDLHITIRSYNPETERALLAMLSRLPELLVVSCPCLKMLKLTIQTQGHLDTLLSMLEDFETLEEVSFERCTGLKDADFVGPNEENPRFHQLKRLKKLSLIGLDLMPNLSDVLFSSVIRYMKLTHLTITACRPIRSVSLQGIESLLEGPFSESIEKFSFEGWSLDQVSPEEVQALARKFRPSSNV